MAAAGLMPAEHVVDAGYTSADLLLGARARGITLLGPLLSGSPPQARSGGYTADASAQPHAEPPPMPLSAWSTTGSCLPPTGSLRICGHGRRRSVDGLGDALRPGTEQDVPVPNSVLQPMLAAAGYLVTVLGPHTLELFQQAGEAGRRWSLKSGDHIASSRLPVDEIAQFLVGHERRGEPLPFLPVCRRPQPADQSRRLQQCSRAQYRPRSGRLASYS